MEATKQRQPSASKKRSSADSFKQFVSTRRGAYTVALLAATLAGLVLLVFVNQYKDDVNSNLEPAPVLTADRLIPRGTSGSEVVAGKLFKIGAIAEEDIAAGAVTQADQLVGKVAVRDVLPGQQITTADFAAEADAIRSRLTKTDRALQIPIDKIHGLMTTIHAGDRVDILASVNETDESTGSTTPELEVLVRDIRIMTNAGDSVILETTDREGARIAAVADGSKLWFMLRPPIGATDSSPGRMSEASTPGDDAESESSINGQPQQETP